MPTAEDLRRHPGRVWTRERWGDRGRPVLLINHPSHDRSAWWPIAALLADDHAVAVFDLPVHGGPGDLADDLADFTARSGSRAPIVVGHDFAALVATVFAARYLAHAAVNVDQYLDAPAIDARGRVLRAITSGPASIRCPYLSVFANPVRDGYNAWLKQRIPRARCEVYATPGTFPHLVRVQRFADDIRSLSA